MLSNTKLSTTLHSEMLFKVQRLGDKIRLEPNQFLFQDGDNPDYLYVVLEGDTFVERASKQIWIGFGDIIGEIGFILGTKRTGTVRAGTSGCTLWRVHRSLLFQNSNLEITILMTHLLVGLAPSIHIRLLEIVNDDWLVEPDLIEKHCDSDHSSIQQVAALLRGEDDWESAINVWEFVRNLPYRFGFWRLKASQTLELGFGMCTTKSNLQVALLRALGIESQFGESQVHSKYVIPFLPPAYRTKTRKDIKHYFGVVKLDGQWFISDASFSKEALQMLAEAYPQLSYLVHDSFQKAKHFYVKTEDKFEYQMTANLSHVMRKKPFYKEGNVEAMNILLDKRQGVSSPIPDWVKPTLDLLSYNPKAALSRAIVGLIVESNKFISLIKKKS
jgi:CRP-like cAMP-binding protein